MHRIPHLWDKYSIEENMVTYFIQRKIYSFKFAHADRNKHDTVRPYKKLDLY